jgi:predicted dehydrogenase
LDRRDFLKTASLLATGPGAGAARNPSDRLRVGFIGCGGRGRGLLRLLSRFPDVDLPVLSDVIEPRLNEAREMLGQGARPQKPELAVDYRRILDRKDIDAVFIATTQHQHGLPFIHSCQAGKHVYVEKPLSHTVAEGRAMVAAARKHGVLTLVGTQQRAGPHYQKAVELIRAGRLGKIGLVECWNYADRLERAGRHPDSEPPPGYHWDSWLGPAPKVPFNRARLEHNWWFDYGGGVLGNWGPHHFDIVLWAMGVEAPKSAVATGGKFVVDDIADTPDVMEAAWEFPGFLLTFRHRSFSNFHHLQSRPRHYGIAFYGKQATLVIDRFGYDVYSNTGSKPYALYQFPLEPPVETREGKQSEQDGPYQRAFLDCVKEGRQPPVDVEFSHRVAVCFQLGNIAYLTRRRIEWDARRETIPGDPEATRLLARPRRKGYELPKA